MLVSLSYIWAIFFKYMSYFVWLPWCSFGFLQKKYFLDSIRPILKLNKKTTPLTTPHQEESLLFAYINVDLHQTFRIAFITFTKFIWTVKDDTILQVSNQEPSTSTKPPMENGADLANFKYYLKVETWPFTFDTHEVQKITYCRDRGFLHALHVSSHIL